MTRVSIPDSDHLGASAVGNRPFQCLHRHDETDEGNATGPLHSQHLGEQRFVAAAQAAGDGDRLAAESELPRAGRGAKRGECELRASGYPLFLLSRHVRTSRSQFKMTSELRNPGAPSAASARRPR